MNFNKARVFFVLLGCLLLATGVFISNADAFLSPVQVKNERFTTYARTFETIPILRSQLALADDAFVTISAKSFYVLDLTSNTVLAERNAERILRPASTTKLMTALIALELWPRTMPITTTSVPELSGFKSIFPVGQQYYLEDLIRAALIQSSNDAAYLIAQQHSEGISGFVARMNERAQELGLESTYFENPAGFDADNQISSARDLAILTKEFLRVPFLAEVVATSQATITTIDGKFSVPLRTTHQLLGKDPSVLGVKTGTTEGANQVLITLFERENRQILVVLMGSDDRYLETVQLTNWVFEWYDYMTYEELLASVKQDE